MQRSELLPVAAVSWILVLSGGLPQFLSLLPSIVHGDIQDAGHVSEEVLPPFAAAEDAWVTAAVNSIQKYINMGMVGIDIDYEFTSQSHSDPVGPDWVNSMCKMITVCPSSTLSMIDIALVSGQH